MDAREMPMATLIKTVAMVIGTYISIPEMIYFIPHWTGTMLFENNIYNLYKYLQP